MNATMDNSLYMKEPKPENTNFCGTSLYIYVYIYIYGYIHGILKKKLHKLMVFLVFTNKNRGFTNNIYIYI